MMRTRDLQLHLPMHTGNVTSDKSGNSVVPTYNNTDGLTSIAVYPPCAKKSIQPFGAGGLEYDKSLMGSPGSLGNGAFTLSFWFYLENDGTANNQWLFVTTDNSGSARGIQVYVKRSSMTIVARIKKYGSAWWELETTDTISYNTWYNVVVSSHDNSQTGGFSLALNGRTQDVFTQPDFRDADLHDIKIGRGYSDATTLLGYISNIKVFTRPVAASDAARLQLGLHPLH